MKKKKLFKCLVVVVLICVTLFSACSNTFAKINEDYMSDTNDKLDDNLEEKIKSSVVIDALGSFLYGIASWIESLIRSLYHAVSGYDMFPWADRIIFNAIPMLDVNFLNPSENTLFLNNGKETILATVVRNSYYTIFAIAVGFLSILVAIMAIKLAISTIAAEKAQYKKAITRWVFTMVMLFVMHFAMSLIFYVNEQIVRVASSFLTKSFEDIKIDNDIFDPLTKEDKEQILKNYSNTDRFKGEQRDIAVKLLESGTYKKIIDKNMLVGDGEHGENTGLEAAFIEKDLNAVIELKNNPSKQGELEKLIVKYSNSVTPELIKEITFQSTYPFNHYKELTWWVKQTPTEAVKSTVLLAKLYLSIARDEKQESLQATDIIKDMATFFKESAFTYNRGTDGKIKGWKASKISIQGAILYTIFVFQSILYLYSYIKRFFFIIMLAIMAPAIVIFDFFAKSVS